MTSLLLAQLASIASAVYLANHIVPAPQPNAQQETWTLDSLYLSFSYLCVVQVLPKSNTVGYPKRSELKAPRSCHHFP